MHLRVVTPKCEKVSLEVDSVTLPGAKGEICILPGHTALISTLEVGILQYAGKQSGKLAVNRGFAEVLNDEVTVLTETAERPQEVDFERARLAAERAQQRLAALGVDPNLDVARAEYALRRAIARLNLHE